MKTCVECGSSPVENHHYKGMYASQLGGGGRNLKTYNWLVSEICRKCHRGLHDMSGKFKNYNKEQFTLIQFWWAFETIQRKILRQDWDIVKGSYIGSYIITSHDLLRYFKKIERKINRGEIIIK